MLIGSPVPEYLGGAAVKSPVFPNLEILDNLTLFNAADIRPALVRELTYLYVQKPTHTSEEEHQYTELLLRLIDAVDVATRKLVAARLANQCACASTAAGNTIHSARLSRLKKLIAGSVPAIHARTDIAMIANAPIKIARCHGLRTNIAT